jgi:capsular polysaccharide transport system ATP-binding protein
MNKMTSPLSSAPLALRHAVPARKSGPRIAADGLCKSYDTPSGPKHVLKDVSFAVGRGEKMAVLGRNGAGKSTLVKIVGGVERPSRGVIRRGMSMSWPLAFGGGFEVAMTGLDNIRFIARLYNRPIRETIERVDDFAELGSNLLLPVRQYSAGMSARLAFALTLAIDFDCYLIDEVISVGDQRFHRKCHEALFVERKDAAMILVSHDMGIIREYCSSALVLKGGHGRVFDELDLAISIYATL